MEERQNDGGGEQEREDWEDWGCVSGCGGKGWVSWGAADGAGRVKIRGDKMRGREEKRVDREKEREIK